MTNLRQVQERLVSLHETMARLYLNAANNTTEVEGEHVEATLGLIRKLEMVVYHTTEAESYRSRVSK